MKLLFTLALLSALLGAANIQPQYQELGGEFILQEDGTYWYLHSAEEFEGIDCNRCHSEMSDTIWFCPDKEQDCVFYYQNGHLTIKCSGGLEL